MPRPCARFSCILALTGLIAAACGAGDGAAPTSATSSTSTTQTATTTTQATTSVPDTWSQSPSDAARDGVVAELAALPLAVRVDAQASVNAAEGRWVLSRPSSAADAHADGCRIGPEAGRYPTDFICTTEYGELLLLDARSGEILRAFPLPGVPGDGLIVTADAVYCWRTGDPMLPDAMVCRVDRTTLEATVVVYPAEDSIVVQPCFYPPSSWSAAGSFLDVASLTFEAGRLWANASAGTRIELDSLTLAPAVAAGT